MKPDEILVQEFLESVDGEFPVPLSQKQDLGLLSKKFCERATLCTRLEDGKIVAMVAGYTENLVDNMAYISVVATLDGFKGRGLASELIKEFIDICCKRNIEAVHLYTDATNLGAMHMYQKLGFEKWDCPNEPRPLDVHFRYLI